MRRREVLKAATVGMGAVSVGALPEWLRAASEESDNKVDVLVVGGGTAGTIAAIQAARAGARTMLVEMGSQLGGVGRRSVPRRRRDALLLRVPPVGQGDGRGLAGGDRRQGRPAPRAVGLAAFAGDRLARWAERWGGERWGRGTALATRAAPFAGRTGAPLGRTPQGMSEM
jgi:choline dehydrogenase-like flavoprotein